MNMFAVFMEYRISMMFMLVFIYAFTERRYSKRKTIAILAACYIAIAGIEYIEYFINGKQNNDIFTTSLEVIILQGSCLSIQKNRNFKGLFVGITSAAYAMIGNTVWNFTQIYFHNWCLVYASQIFVHLSILLIIIFCVRELFMKPLIYADITWKYLCTVSAMYYVITYAMTIWPINMNENPVIFAPIAILFLLIILEYIYFVRLLISRAQIDEDRLNKEHMQVYRERIEQEIENILKKEEEVAIVRHDLRHYMKLLYGYVQEGDTDKIKVLLEQTDERLKQTQPKRFCDNLSGNVVASNCLSLAERMHVSLDLNLQIPGKIKCSEIEYATVMSNLIENAIYAAMKVSNQSKRKVKVKIQQIKEQLVLEVMNYYEDDNLVTFIQNGTLPKSEKGKNHGVGMKSIKAFVEKYEAVFDYYTQDDKFYVKLIIF